MYRLVCTYSLSSTCSGLYFQTISGVYYMCYIVLQVNKQLNLFQLNVYDSAVWFQWLFITDRHKYKENKSVLI